VGPFEHLRVWLEQHDAPYVLALKRNDTLITAGPDFAFSVQRADTLIAAFWAWSHWRRRRQSQAHVSHYLRRGLSVAGCYAM
jgi:hypothetical protein